MPSRPIEACGAEHRPRGTATYASRLLHLAAGNALVLAAGLALIAGVGEIALRLAVPFMETREPIRFVPAVGYLREPLAEIRWTNYRDYWTAARANSWGFLDREPVSPSRAEASCHVALIGDSFVEAKQVPIADKVQVQLATRAAQALPGWDVTTSAFGTGGTGQLNQLPFYDVYARRLRPKLLVLVFVSNDFADNSAVLQALDRGWDPDRLPFVSVARDAEGALQLRPPDREHEAFRLPRLPRPRPSWFTRVWRKMQRVSYFARWIEERLRDLTPGADPDPQLRAWAALLRQRPGYAALLAGWEPTTRPAIYTMFRAAQMPFVFQEALTFTEFALDQFRARAARDGFALVILASYTMARDGEHVIGRMQAMADARDIPVIDQYAYIRRQGAEAKDARWSHDAHWNVAGHRWAAEALLEYLQLHPEICGASPA